MLRAVADIFQLILIFFRFQLVNAAAETVSLSYYPKSILLYAFISF